ncbi:MAG: hypothetical protein QOG94_2853, partial [Solirubrobacteraceae bacterium]|nr:hypothetical protein [Solirubrobacteraceae bacterium]
MPRMLTKRPSPSMIVALLSLFVSLGGVGYAAATIGSSQIKDNTVRGKDVKNNDLRSADIRDATIEGKDVKANTLTGAKIQESTLGIVQAAVTATNAGNAATVGGRSADSLRLQCPVATSLAAGLCFETAKRPAAHWFAAQAACAAAGRRVPTIGELFAYSNIQGTSFRSVELSASVGNNGTQSYYLQFKQDDVTSGIP